MKSHCRACSARGTFCVNKNPVKRPGPPGVLVAQWLEHTNGVTEVVGGRSRPESLKFFSVVPLHVAMQPPTTCSSH